MKLESLNEVGNYLLQFKSDSEILKLSLKLESTNELEKIKSELDFQLQQTFSVGNTLLKIDFSNFDKSFSTLMDLCYFIQNFPTSMVPLKLLLSFPTSARTF